MYQCKYPHLFSPIRLAGRWFRNRLFAAPMGYEYLTSRNYPLEETVAFFERRAVGGAAAVSYGSGAVDSRRGVIGLSNPHLDDPTALPALHRLASAINRHGAVAAIELQHTGANSYICAARGEQIYGAVDGENALGQFVPAMPEEVILETIEAFADAAAFAKFCGFGLVTVHAGHGWLLHQFLDPTVNKRKDRWGGSLENRCRFLLAVVERIKQKCGRDFPVDVRISGASCYEGGYDLDEGVRIAKQLDGKVDLIHVSAGSHEVPEVFTVTHPSMFLPEGANVHLAAEIKKHVRTPVAAVGALADPDFMEEILASGKADVVQVARGLLADPDLPKKARAGLREDIRPCLRCFECFAGITTKRQYRCAVNPEIGFEQESLVARPPARRKTVLVAGGGVAGMQAALTAAERGHRVVLLEKRDRLGGVLLCEERVPFKRLLGQYLAYQVRQVTNNGVEVKLGTPADPELARSLEPEVIIAAVGSRAAVPSIPGIGDPRVLGAEQAYLEAERTGRRVVVLGGGLVGIELAVYLASLGRQVTIMEMQEILSDGGNPVHGLALMKEIRRYGIEVVTATRAVEITDEGVVGQYVGSALTLPRSPTVEAAVLQSSSFRCVVKSDSEVGSRRVFPADTVVYATGREPCREEVEPLRFCAPEFYEIGDCWCPRNIQEATRMAHAVARDL